MRSRYNILGFVFHRRVECLIAYALVRDVVHARLGLVPELYTSGLSDAYPSISWPTGTALGSGGYHPEAGSGSPAPQPARPNLRRATGSCRWDRGRSLAAVTKAGGEGPFYGAAAERAALSVGRFLVRAVRN